MTPPVRPTVPPTVPTTVRLVGGPTVLLTYAGLRLLTDPTFDPPGPVPSPVTPGPPSGRTLTKLTGPAVAAEDLGPLDAVLLSHDQHADNLDVSGYALLARVPTVLTTTAAAGRLGVPATGLEPWHATELAGDGVTVQVTAVPAQHGPVGTEHVTGPVLGFVLTAPGLPTVYVSGDNASVRVVEEVADHLGPIDAAVLFVGAARSPLLRAALTLTADQAVRAARTMGAWLVVPVHAEGWAHFSQGVGDVRAAFEAAGLGDVLAPLAPGESAALPHR